MTLPVSLANVRAAVDTAVRHFLQRQRPLLADGDLAPLLSAAEDLLAQGKRLRPAFCYWGWRGAGGAVRDEVFTAAASLELLQASALVHDDVIDESDTRRGMPAAHRRFAALHSASGWRGSRDQFGMGAAVLLGDLLLSWADEMYQASGLHPDVLQAGRTIYDVMRTELMSGQYLDLRQQAAGEASVVSAMRVARYKSGKYTVERPLQLGATLAAAVSEDAVDGELVRAYTDYGLKIGIAFQLRDDLLGVFGDPAETGKPAGDDLRQGKRTVLVASTLELAAPAAREEARELLGGSGLDDDGIARLRSIITESGARRYCEDLIAAHTQAALEALQRAPMTAEARDALTGLASAATARSC